MAPDGPVIRRPPAAAAALLVLAAAAAAARLAASHVLVREATGLAGPTLAAAAASPAPTPPARLRGRDAPAATVCGYIGRDPALPATCAEGSHCAVNLDHGVVGCCPDGQECTQGIFTACVDRNSSPQTVRDPYVFTCRARDVCYRNSFDGGFYQYGCGSASHLAAHVAATAPGRPPLDLSRVAFAFTATPTPLPTPVVIGALSPTTSRLGSNRGQTSRPGPSVPSAASEADAPPGDPRPRNTGAIIGGTIGGVAALAALLALCAVLLRRRKGPRRHRQRSFANPPMGDARHRFEQLPSSQSAGPGTAAIRHRPFGTSNLAAVPSNDDGLSPPRTNYLSDVALPDGDGDLGRDSLGDLGSDPRAVEADQIPLTRDVGGLSPDRSLTRTASRENDNATLATQDSASSYRGPRRNGGGALWQQNRRQRRNPTWI